MAKIGTAHIEIKPVLDEAALADVRARLNELGLNDVDGINKVIGLIADLCGRVTALEGRESDKGAISARDVIEEALRHGPSAACTTACPRGGHIH